VHNPTTSFTAFKSYNVTATTHSGTIVIFSICITCNHA